MASNLGARGGVFIDILVFKKMLAGDASTRPNSLLFVPPMHSQTLHGCFMMVYWTKFKQRGSMRIIQKKCKNFKATSIIC